MKRNLSSQAIRAMAIGMAVTLGSATAVSGVVTGTVVNVYALGSGTHSTNVTKAEATTVDGKTVITLTLTGTLSKEGNITTSDYTISGATGSPTVESVEQSEQNVVIKLNKNIASSDQNVKITVADANNDNKACVLVDSVGFTVTDVPVTNNVDDKAPTIKGDVAPDYKSVDSTITLTADEKLATLNTTNNSNNFTIEKASTSGDDSITVKDFKVGEGNAASEKLVLTLSKPAVGTSLKDGEYKINYKTEKAELKDEAGNKLAKKDNIASFLVTENQSKVTAKVNQAKTEVTLTTTGTLTKAGNPVATEFKVNGNTSANSINIDEAKKTITLTFNQVLSESNLKLSYDPSDSVNAVKVDSKVLFLKDLAVTEDDQVSTAPTIQSGVINNDAPDKVILTFSENVKVDIKSDQPNPTDFLVKVDGQENAVKSLSEISDDASTSTLTLTLTNEVKKGQEVKLHYKNNSGKAIKNAQNKELAEIKEINAIQITNKVSVKPPVSNDLTATTTAGTYKFKKLTDTQIALVEFTAARSRAAKTDNTFENGILTANGKTYTLTEIGDGTKAVDGLTTKALEGHTSNITTIKAKAFENNTTVTTLSFPKVTSVGANAFNGATSLTSIDLGSASKNLELADNAFTGADSLKNIATSKENKDKVDAAIKVSGVQATVITDENSNDTNATIAKDKFYQTKEGLIFKGLSDKELSFEGKDKFTAPTKPNGLTGETKEKAYLVTYKDGVVSLKAGEKPPVEESFDVTVKNKKLTFKPLTDNTVALASVGAHSVMRVSASNTLQDGVLTVGSKTYNFTQIGDGTNSLGVDFDANTVLAGNLDKVTTVAKDAFNGNTTLTKISLPNVTTIAEGAFNGTTALTEVFLGNKEVTVAKDAFKGTKSDIKVSSNNDKTIENLKNPETGLDNNKVENAAPFVKSAVVNKGTANKVVVTFSEKVYAPTAINAGDFKIEGVTSNPTVNKVTGLEKDKQNAKDTITLELSAYVKAGEAPVLKYKKTTNPIQDIADQSKELAEIKDSIKITNNIEAGVVLPKVTEAKVENAAKDKIVLTLDQDPKQSLETSDKDNFSLKITGGTTDHKITNVETSSKKITITLDKELAADNTEIKLSYYGNKIETLTDRVVTNNIQAQAVDMTVAEGGATANGTTLTITTDKFLKTGAPNKAGFTVTRDGGSINVASVSTNDSKNITLTLDGQGVEATHTEIKVQYQGTDLLEKDTNKVINGFTTPFVINEKDVTAPTLSTATASGSQQSYTITLPVSEPIKQTADPKSKFAVTVTGADSSGKTVTVGSATIDSNTKKSITLNVTTNKALDIVQDKFQVVYTKGDELVDLKDNQLDTKTIQDITITSSRVASILAHSDSDLVAIAKVNENQEGKVTVVNSFKDTDKDLIQSMLTSDLRKIANNAFKDISNIELDFSKLSSIGVIDDGAFNGASNLTIKYTGSDKEVYELAKKLKNISGVTVNNKEPNNVIKDYENNNNNNGGSGSGGGSSSGGSGGGSGANIGTITNKKPNTEETTSQGNKNETVVENKQLNFDVIKLPSVEGEAKVFGDVSANHWAKSYIDKLSTARIINGSNGMFNPNGQTKRADVTVMLVNLLGLTPEANNKFADVNASAYYAPYVGTASTYGIVNGSNGMFNPQGVISRQDTMVMIAQILKGLNLNVNADTTALSQFGDASKVSAYANESVAILVNSGIIAGNNGKLNPTAPVTRAEMATIMSKLYDVLASANK